MDQSLGPLFSGKYVWTSGPESSSKVLPEIGIGPWMALLRPIPFATKYFPITSENFKSGNGNKHFDKDSGPRRVMSRNSRKYNRYWVIFQN